MVITKIGWSEINKHEINKHEINDIIHSVLDKHYSNRQKALNIDLNYPLIYETPWDIIIIDNVEEHNLIKEEYPYIKRINE